MTSFHDDFIVEKMIGLFLTWPFTKIKKISNIFLFNSISVLIILILLLGRGSFAKVYKGYKKRDESQKYAIKAFNKDFMLAQYKG